MNHETQLNIWFAINEYSRLSNKLNTNCMICNGKLSNPQYMAVCQNCCNSCCNCWFKCSANCTVLSDTISKNYQLFKTISQNLIEIAKNGENNLKKVVESTITNMDVAKFGKYFVIIMLVAAIIVECNNDFETYNMLLQVASVHHYSKSWINFWPLNSTDFFVNFGLQLILSLT